MLQIKDLKIKIWEKQILNWVDFDFKLWQNYAILGKNGSGKSSLALTIMWNPKYDIVWWDILLDGESVKKLTPDQRSQKWIFLAFQNIPEIPWVKVFDFLKAIYNANLLEWEKQITFLKFKSFVQPFLDELNIPKEFLFRDLNVWFSWWEKRKLEFLQLKLLNPKYIILDEIDSWLDVNAIQEIWNIIKSLISKDKTFIIISHYFKLFDFVDIDEATILENGQVKDRGWKPLIEKIKKHWF